MHVWVDNQDTCLINLRSRAYIARPIYGTCRDIMAASSTESQADQGNWADHTREQTMSTVRVTNADQMMIAVTPSEDGISASFADGYSGMVPFGDIPEIRDASGLNNVELPNPYEVILTTTQDKRVELPWDFVRHYCDRNYRPRIEMIAAEGRQLLGTRVRAFREAAGLTQESLARAAGIGRVTLVRLENGKHTPKVSTLAAIAQVLERPVEDLFASPDESGLTG